MDITRRSLLKFMGGAVAGAVLSPLPWKLLDDASIWTQNWSRIARPPRGPIGRRDTTCTLCPAGCGLRARLVGASFVSAWPQPGHPGPGAACPLGLAMAQMRYHPARVRGACVRDASRDDAPWRVQDAGALVADLGRRLATLRARGDTGAVAVLDLRPGRALSRQYREFLRRLGDGQYLVAPDGWQSSAAAFATLAGAAGAAVAPAPAPARARSILALGTPPDAGPFGAGARAGGAGAEGPFRIQVDPVVTTAAARADLWLPARPGSEAALALAIAHVLVREELAGDARVRALAAGGREGSFAGLADEFAPERVAPACGLEPGAIRAAARELARRRPALVLGVGDPGAGPLGEEEETAAWCLALLLGAPGPQAALGLRPSAARLLGDDLDDEEGVAAHGRAALPPATNLDAIPDGSLDLLVVDGSIPGAPLSPLALRRKLRGPGSMVVALSPYAAGVAGAAADVILPTPAPGEWLDDVPTPALSPASTYAWSPPVAAPPGWARHAADWLADLAGASGIGEDDPPLGAAAHRAELERRVARLHATGEGAAYDPRDGGEAPVSGLGSPSGLAAILRRGGAWSAPASLTLDDAAWALPGHRGAMASRWRALGEGRAPARSGDARPYVLLPGGGLSAAGAIAPPVLTKLYRESELQPGAGTVAVNPLTARRAGLSEGVTARLSTADGACEATVRLDASLPPGALRLATGPGPRGLGDLVEPGRPDIDVPALCGAAARPVWRVAAAGLEEVRHARG